MKTTKRTKLLVGKETENRFSDLSTLLLLITHGDEYKVAQLLGPTLQEMVEGVWDPGYSIINREPYGKEMLKLVRKIVYGRG